MAKEPAIYRITAKCGRMREPLQLYFATQEDADAAAREISRIYDGDAIVDRFLGMKLFAGPRAVADAVETVNIYAQY